MSKQRQKDRAARETAAQQAATRAAVQAKRRPAGKAPGRPPKGKAPVYRQRRFPPLPWRLKAALALGWLAVVLLGAYLFPTWLGRLGIAVVATMCLPLIVVIVRDPTRRTSR